MFDDAKFTDMITTGDEVVLYFLIDGLRAFIWRTNHEMCHGRIPPKDHAEGDRSVFAARRQSLLAVEQCKRFGIAALDDDGHPTDDYWTWYRRWDAWKKGLTDDGWAEVDAALLRGLTADEAAQYRAAAMQEAVDVA